MPAGQGSLAVTDVLARQMKGREKMKMSDIIRISGKGASKEKRFSLRAKDEDNALRMNKIALSDNAFTDEGKSIEELYQKYLAEARTIFNRAIISYDILPPESHIKNLAVEAAGKLQVCHINIMDFFMRSQGREENYLYSHTANVTFLSVMIGVWLKYNRSQLSQLAVAAAFHDIGMVKVLDIALLPKRLSPAERKEVDKHYVYSKEFLEQLQGIDTKIIDAVRDHHRRRKINARSVNEYAQIIGLADIFEAMTHPRPYRSAIEPHRAVHAIIEEAKDDFDSRIIKALIDNIGIYPAGTFVRLDTGEAGLVIDVNPGSPLSPKVNILLGKDGERLAEPRTADLTKQTSVHIEAPLDHRAQQRLKESLS